ncbi:hypothetical protein BGZ61DRAFT_399325 [Ilyonectria robusta]|uniref:uncharacterized protein n=1 Tax=Ilyonectria robusta TaxID=1079257 RepID=UPI001E8CC40D|nr:uncharacterized protein BGZ61DRAFT_399325 [Ilyonectria robusta]KAH8669871.1 hypothetical protein BGZ61DRAFT_399325 [Ilyonectria robusta]
MEGTERQDFLINRARLPSSDVAVFLENRVSIPGQPGPVFVDRLDRVETLEEALNQETISKELWKQANDEKDRLFALMEQVRARLDKKLTSSIQSEHLDLRCCTWDRVMEEVQTTASRWSTTPKKTSKMMMCLDRLGRNSDAFQSWIQVLPGGDYGSSICGVFALAVGAVGNYAKVEESILDSLAQIPEVIENTRRYIEIYSELRNQHLEARTFDLYLSILKALTHIMQFFADSSFRKVYQPFLKQSSYQRELLASLEAVKAQATRVKEEANQCMQRRLMNMDQSRLISDNVLLDTNQTSNQSLRILQNVYKLLASRMESHSFSEETFATVVSSRQSSLLRLGQKESQQVSSDNTDDVRKLLKLIQFDLDRISKDIETCLRLGDAMNETSKAKAAKLIQNQVFKAFMTTDLFSTPLLVNGNEDMSCAEGLSPYSLVAARLTQVSEQAESTFGIAYFCSEHRPYGNDSTVPVLVSMMASLLGQLITLLLGNGATLDLSFLDELSWNNLKKMKLKSLCAVFEELTSQIPQGNVLFCILDEISLYETGLLRQDTEAVLRRLTRLTRRRKEIIFKLLVTCRGRAVDVVQYFTGHVLDMDDSAEADDSSTWQIANLCL